MDQAVSWAKSEEEGCHDKIAKVLHINDLVNLFIRLSIDDPLFRITYLT